MEVYTVDVCSKSNLIVYGSNKDFAEVFNFVEDRPIFQARDFSDSVIYTKIVDEFTYIFVSLNGIIVLVSEGKEKEHFQLEEDISMVAYNNDLLIGTTSGHVYFYNNELIHINTYHSHSTEIIALCWTTGGDVMSLDSHSFQCSDRYGRSLYRKIFSNAKAMCYIGGDVYCVASDGKIEIFRRETRLFVMNIENEVNSMLYLGTDIVVGGDFPYILLINTFAYATYKLPVEDYITNIIQLDNHSVAFSTSASMIGVLDIRNIKSLKYYDPRIGDIFDLKANGNIIIAGGKSGFCVLNKDGTEYECENSFAKNTTHSDIIISDTDE